MKLIYFFIMICCCDSVLSQDFSYPTLPHQGRQLKDFIPRGWTILDTACGDMNMDKLTDYALILQHTDSVRLKIKEDGYIDTVTTQPRILAILFSNHSSQSLILSIQSNTFILCHDNPNIEDPYQGISIKNGNLVISFSFFANAGTWYASSSIYVFRHLNNTLVLIGADCHSIHRATLDYADYSFNFLTRRWKSEKGNEQSNKKPEVKWHTLPVTALKTFKSFKAPFSWTITNEIVL